MKDFFSIFQRIKFFSKPDIKKWPTLKQWIFFPFALVKKEKILFAVFLTLSFVSFIFLAARFYYKNTEVRPVSGGVYIEGVVGQPRFINPVYANSDADRDLTELIFSGLMKYDEKMKIVPDLSQNYEIENDGKTYKFYLKDNIYWEDKQPLTADDVIFTIETIQNPDYKSPLRANWVGVDVKKINDLTIQFDLKKQYSSFIENCTVKILPKHVWQSVSPDSFAFDNNNLNPLSSGPYKIKDVSQDAGKIKSITLVSNSLYSGKKPYIPEVRFMFFENEKALSDAAQWGKIKGLSISSAERPSEKWNSYDLSMPRYFAVFFNSEKKDIISPNVRIALNYATNKKEISKKILGSEDTVIDSPILPDFYGYNKPTETYGFDINKANEILDKEGFKDLNNDGIREKTIQDTSFRFKKDLKVGSQGEDVNQLQKCLSDKFPDLYPEKEVNGYFGNKTKDAVIAFQEKFAEEILDPWNFKEGTGLVSRTTRDKLNEVCFGPLEQTVPLQISLVTVDQPQLVKAAEELKKEWEAVGVDAEIGKFPISQLEQDFIKPRNYEALLFGEVLGAEPDLFPFWHSSQKKDPGLNLSVYDNKEADKLLEDARKASDPQIKSEKLAALQDVLIKDAPFILLYDPYYEYYVIKDIKGINISKIIDPSKRFSNIENWFIKTKRIWK